MSLAGDGEKGAGTGGNCHPSKFEKALISKEPQGQFSTVDLTQAFEEIFF